MQTWMQTWTQTWMQTWMQTWILTWRRTWRRTLIPSWMQKQTQKQSEKQPEKRGPPQRAAGRVISLAGDKTTAFGWARNFADLCRLPEPYGSLFRTRLAETRLLPATQDLLTTYRDSLAVVALVTPEDPDTIAVLPILARMVAASPRMDLRVVTDDEDLALLKLLLGDVNLASALEEWDLPQVFWFDEDWELQAQWGPRPAAAEPQLESWLRAHPAYDAGAEDEVAEGQLRYAALTRSLISEMRLWYNTTLAAAMQLELTDLLASLQTDEEPGYAGDLAGRAR